jgi:beta-lactamase class A
MATDWSGVEAAAHEVAATGTLGIAIVAPDGEWWEQHGDRRFAAASTVKIPIMIACYRQIDAGRWRLDETHTLAEDDKAAGSGVLLHLHAGLTLTLEDLIYLMISISDNTATNLLIRLVGMEAIGRTMRELGMTASTLGREMKGRPALPGEAENWATPGEYARVVEAILDDRAAAPDSCAAMRAMLERQQNPRRIARHLAPSSAIRWGSKTGSVAGVTNDVGYVSGPNGRLVVAAFAENFPDGHLGERAIGHVVRAALAATGVAAPLYTS